MSLTIEQQQLDRFKESKKGSLGRYILTKLHFDDEYLRSGVRKLRFGLWNRPKIDLTRSTTYVVTPERVGKIYHISADVYSGDISLWWAIASVNNIKNPLTDMEAGMILIIPTTDAIQASLSRSNEGDY